MRANIILFVLILISFIILAFVLNERKKFIDDYYQTKNIENNISATSTERENQSDQDVKKHIVQPGDTLWDIAEKHYGSGHEYSKIIEKNPSKTFKFIDGRQGLIYPGTELIL